MGPLFVWHGRLAGGGVASVLTAISDSAFQWFAKAKDTNLEGFKAAAGLDAQAYEAWLRYEAAQAANQAAARSWIGCKILMVVVALPACLHVGLVFLDSTFKLGCPHYGCLGVPDVPGRWVATENTVISFLFGVSVVGPMASAVTAWLHRR